MSKPDDKEGVHGSVDQSDLAASKREFIETFFKRGAEFTEELMRENEKLRYRVVQLEEERKLVATASNPGAPGSGALRELVARIEGLEAERSELLNRFAGVEKLSHDFSMRYHDIERENNNLANLYVASYQLHSTMDLREVTQIILEILLNFVGAKTFAIQLVDEEHKKLRTLASEGIDRGRVPERALGAAGGKLGEAIVSGQTFVDLARLRARADLERPLTVVPLKIKDQVVGAIVIWDFLSQKTALADVDYELFNLLAAHAASSLQGAWLTGELKGRPAALWAATDVV
jgi:hypothetical protein